MKLTKKQQQEIDVLKWFAQKPYLITDDDIQTFIEISEQGKHKDIATRALLQPKDFSQGIVELLAAKKNREITVKMWMEDWGDTVNSWSFTDEPQLIAEWIAKTLDREAIMVAWHEARAEEWQEKIEAKRVTREDGSSMILNKPLDVRRS